MTQTHKILVVDDQPENLLIMVNYLKDQARKFEVLQSNMALRALTIAEEELPDLIISDWDMPGMDGLEFIKALKNKEITRDIPVLMATGIMLSSENLRLALEAGAMDYIRKPIDPVELYARVSSALTISTYHKKVLEAKNNELTEFALMMVKNQEFTTDLRADLDKLTKMVTCTGPAQEQLNAIIQQVDQRLRLYSYDKFELAFNRVHPTFTKKLLEQYPDLTSGELKLCIYIRLGMTIKDVSTLLFLNPDSVKVARSRLRKKINMDANQKLETFLSGI